jgi:hypothetical protein
MRQFINTEHANEAARSAFEQYRSNTERIKNIEKRVNDGEIISKEDILWVCETAKFGIMAQESSWYDHG